MFWSVHTWHWDRLNLSKAVQAEVGNSAPSSTAFMKNWICSSATPTFLRGVDRNIFYIFTFFTLDAVVMKCSGRMTWIECVSRLWEWWEVRWKFGLRIMVVSLSLGYNIRLKGQSKTVGFRGQVSECCNEYMEDLDQDEEQLRCIWGPF